ncbi:MAG TPA: TrmH family RNA methyltransferase [Cyclobacteriaceae bacterium]
MLTNKDLKWIKSLQQKKYRELEQAFLVEGEKNLLELINSSEKILKLLITSTFEQKYKSLLSIDYDPISSSKLVQIGTFTSNNAGIAVVEKHNYGIDDLEHDQLIVLIDSINDPGNLGTIIRTCDWFGVSQLLCSPSTADYTNPKVINATKGSFTRVRVIQTDLENYLKKNKSKIVYAATLEGEKLIETKPDSNAILLIGSESHGISENLRHYVDKFITIPKIGLAESLNASIAAGIVLYHFKS